MFCDLDVFGDLAGNVAAPLELAFLHGNGLRDRVVAKAAALHVARVRLAGGGVTQTALHAHRAQGRVFHAEVGGGGREDDVVFGGRVVERVDVDNFAGRGLIDADGTTVLCEEDWTYI